MKNAATGEDGTDASARTAQGAGRPRIGCGGAFLIVMVIGLVVGTVGPRFVSVFVVSDAEPAGEREYTLVEVEDASYLAVTRVSARVVVPPGRTRNELRRILSSAAKDVAAQEDARAVMVFGYRRGGPSSGQYTAGRAILAPNGKWEDAGEDGPLRISVDLADLYFAEPENGLSREARVLLSSRLSDIVDLSSESDSWEDEDIIVRVPDGTEAIVLRSKDFVVSSATTIERLRVRVTVDGKMHTGWVHGINATPVGTGSTE